MPFNIDAFKQNVNDYGYLDNNNFEVIISTPPILSNSLLSNAGTPTTNQEISKRLKLRIDQIQAPGIMLQNAQIQKYGIGVPQFFPINANIKEISFSILVDHFGEIWQYWYNWIRSIYEFSGTDSSTGFSSNAFPSYLAEYKSNYSTVMQIIIYDHFGNAIQKINLFEAFPVSIRELNLSWGDSQLMKLNVSIAFTEFVIVGSTLLPKQTVSRAPIGSEKFSRSINP